MSAFLADIFSYSFLTRAFIAGALVSLCSALLGVTLVLRRYSMIGDGLSHVGFGALAIAAALNLAPLAVAIPVVIIAAFLLLRIRSSGKLKGDSAIALISTGALAVGVMAVSLSGGINTDLYSYMFGSILSMSRSDVIISVVISAAVLILFVILYNRMFSLTFDESFARATGLKTEAYNLILALLTALTIVIGMRIMGTLLISSLIIFPALTAMRVCKGFRSVVVTSAIISVVCFFAGLAVSVLFDTPAGASVVCANILAFGIFAAVGAVKSRS